MPDMSIPPINQCTLDDPTDGAGPLDASSGPAPSPVTTDVRPCLDAPAGAEGASGDCAGELVERFGGQSGAPNADEGLVREGSWQCTNELLRVVATCGSVLSATPQTGGVSLFLAGAACGAALDTLDTCIERIPKQ
jgi:hypothetical protein